MSNGTKAGPATAGTRDDDDLNSVWSMEGDPTQEVNFTAHSEAYVDAMLPLVFSAAKLSDIKPPTEADKKPKEVSNGDDDADSDSDSDSDDDDDLTWSSHHYHKMIEQAETPGRGKMTRLLQETRSFTAGKDSSNLPLSPDAAIFVRVDEDRMDVFKVKYHFRIIH